MKRIFYIILFTFALVTACQKDETPKSLSELLHGEWKLTSPIEASIYLTFAADGSFEEYQRLDNGRFELRRGKWAINENILSGKYNDGEDWSTSYAVIISDKYLTLISQGEDLIEYKYESRMIPEIIRETADIVVKSSKRL